MSVINEMLKDLDKRKSNEQPPLEREVYVQASKQGVDYKLLIIAVLLTGIVSVAVMSYLQSESEPVATPVKTVEVTVKKQSNVATPDVKPAQSAAKQAIEQPETQPRKVEPASGTPKPETNLVHEPQPEPVINEPAQEKVPAITAPKAETELVAPQIEVVQTPTKPIVSSEPSLTIAPVELTPTKLAEKKYKQAMRAIKEKKAYNAEKLLEEALILFPSHLEVRKQLAALWFGRQANGQAINVLAQGIALTPQNEELRIMQARIYAGQSEFDKALNALLPLANSSNSEYQQALATMANQAQKFPEAIGAYQKLIVLNPEQGRWWLGLAIALDSDAQYQQAQLAYQKALTSRQLSQSSETFVRNRLMELGE